MQSTIDEITARKPRTGRHRSLIRALECLHERYGFEPVNIVETGTIRCADDSFRRGDGWSTLTWRLWAEETGSRVWTCDLDPRAIALSLLMTENHPSIEYVTADSVEFLRAFSEPIHLLYLDSFDSGPPGSPQVRYACHHQLMELQAAWRKLDENALVLLDDIPRDFRNGKGELTVPFLHRHGWKLINFEETQALFARRAEEDLYPELCSAY